jgi:cell division protease FtsH
MNNEKDTEIISEGLEKDKKEERESKSTRRKKKFKKVMNTRTITIIMVIVVFCGYTVLNAWDKSQPLKHTLEYNQFMEMLDRGEVKRMGVVETRGTVRVITEENGVTNSYDMVPPNYEGFRRDVLEKGVIVDIQNTTMYDALVSVLAVIPMGLLMIFVVVYISRMLTASNASIFKVFRPEEVITFDDIAGMAEVKKQVKFAVETINNRKKLSEMGARPTKGIVFHGPPGNGKTMLAKAIAGEAGVPFISTSGSDFIEMFVGLGAARVRSLWDVAIMNAPCVVFIDEIDAIGGKRDASSSDSSRESNQTLNALLQKMDGLEATKGIIVIAATNMVETLDTALTRPGRFDKQLYVGPASNKEDREAIVKLYLDKKKVREDVTVEAVSRLLFGMSGAEIETSLNEAVMLALRHSEVGELSLEDIDKASMTTRLHGVAVEKSSEREMKISAYHEAGHALMSALEGKKVSKVSIMPYDSGVGGLTIAHYNFEEKQNLYSKDELMGEIRILVAGYVAEEVFLKETHTGVSNDFQRASVMAYSAVNDYGFEEGSYLNKEAIRKELNTMIDVSDKLEMANNLMKKAIEDVRTTMKQPKNMDIIQKLVSRLLSEWTVIDFQI